MASSSSNSGASNSTTTTASGNSLSNPIAGIGGLSNLAGAQAPAGGSLGAGAPGTTTAGGPGSTGFGDSAPPSGPRSIPGLFPIPGITEPAGFGTAGPMSTPGLGKNIPTTQSDFAEIGKGIGGIVKGSGESNISYQNRLAEAGKAAWLSVVEASKFPGIRAAEFQENKQAIQQILEAKKAATIPGYDLLRVAEEAKKIGPREKGQPGFEGIQLEKGGPKPPRLYSGAAGPVLSDKDVAAIAGVVTATTLGGVPGLAAYLGAKTALMAKESLIPTPQSGILRTADVAATTLALTAISPTAAKAYGAEFLTSLALNPPQTVAGIVSDPYGSIGALAGGLAGSYIGNRGILKGVETGKASEGNKVQIMTDEGGAKYSSIGKDRTKLLERVQQQFEPDLLVKLKEGKVTGVNAYKVTTADGRVFDVVEVYKSRPGMSAKEVGKTDVQYYGFEVIKKAPLPERVGFLKLKKDPVTGEVIIGRGVSADIDGTSATYYKAIKFRPGDSKKAALVIQTVEKAKSAGIGNFKASITKSVAESRILKAERASPELLRQVNDLVKRLNKGEPLKTMEIKRLINLERRANNLKPFTENEFRKAILPVLSQSVIAKITSDFRKTARQITGGAERRIETRGFVFGKGLAAPIPTNAPKLIKLLEKPKKVLLKEMVSKPLEKMVKAPQAIRLKSTRLKTKQIPLTKPMPGKGTAFGAVTSAILTREVPSGIFGNKLTLFGPTIKFGLEGGKVTGGAFGITGRVTGDIGIKSSGEFKTSVVPTTKVKETVTQIPKIQLKSSEVPRNGERTRLKTESRIEQAMKTEQATRQKLKLRQEFRPSEAFRTRLRIRPFTPPFKVPGKKGEGAKLKFVSKPSVKKETKGRFLIKKKFERQLAIRAERPAKSPLKSVIGRDFAPVRTKQLGRFLKGRFEKKVAFGKAALKSGKISKLRTYGGLK